MRIILITVLSLLSVVALAIGLIALVGSRLPASHVASRSLVVKRSAGEVYNLVRDVANAPKWRSDIQSVEMLGEQDGKLHYREHGDQGAVTYEVVEDVPSQRIVTRIVDKDLGYSGSWTTTFAAEASGTRVTITENGEVSNVIFRFLSRYVFGHTATIDAYLSSLEKHFS